MKPGKNSLETTRSSLNRKIELLKIAEAVKEEHRQAMLDAENYLAKVEVAFEIVQTVVQGIQNEVHKQVTSIVSRCLASCFDYEFLADFQTKRNQTEVSLSFWKDGVQHDPLTMSGGGAVDVASFACRLVFIVLSIKHRRRVLILDEPFQYLSADLKPRMRSMLEMLSEEFDFQIIMTTHADGLVAGKVIDLGNDPGDP